MTRAVADVAIAAKDAGRMARVRERVNHHTGALRLITALAIEDALAHHDERSIHEFCAECSARCTDRPQRWHGP